MYFIDVQGTLIDDAHKQPIRGAVALLATLNERQIPYMVVTNNTKRSSSDFLSYLNGIGLEIPKEHYLDPLMTLESVVDKEAVAAYGATEFLEVLEQMGYRLDYLSPKTVLVAVKADFHANEYAQMIDFLLADAALVGMHETTIYAKAGKRYPGVGAVLKMLEFATSKSYTVVGKPSCAFYAEALRRLQLQQPDATYADITMISDDVKGDLSGASALGMQTVFVLSGKYTKAEEIVPYLQESERPQRIYQDVFDVLKAGLQE